MAGEPLTDGECRRRYDEANAAILQAGLRFDFRRLAQALDTAADTYADCARRGPPEHRREYLDSEAWARATADRARAKIAVLN